MDRVKGALLYEGKAKKIFEVQGSSDTVWVSYKDSLTAFNALKKGEFEQKGAINREISSLIFRFLEKKGIATHWISDISPVEMLVKKVKIIPLEVVIRNILAGSTAKKLGIEEGRVLLAANTFRNNESFDLVDQYNNKAAVVQPWRRGALSK